MISIFKPKYKSTITTLLFILFINLTLCETSQNILDITNELYQAKNIENHFLSKAETYALKISQLNPPESHSLLQRIQFVEGYDGIIIALFLHAQLWNIMTWNDSGPLNIFLNKLFSCLPAKTQENLFVNFKPDNEVEGLTSKDVVISWLSTVCHHLVGGSWMILGMTFNQSHLWVHGLFNEVGLDIKDYIQILICKIGIKKDLLPWCNKSSIDIGLQLIHHMVGILLMWPQSMYFRNDWDTQKLGFLLEGAIIPCQALILVCSSFNKFERPYLTVSLFTTNTILFIWVRGFIYFPLSYTCLLKFDEGLGGWWLVITYFCFFLMTTFNILYLMYIVPTFVMMLKVQIANKEERTKLISEINTIEKIFANPKKVNLDKIDKMFKKQRPRKMSTTEEYKTPREHLKKKMLTLDPKIIA